MNKMKNYSYILKSLFLLLGITICTAVNAKEYILTSPDKKVTVTVDIENEIKYAVSYDGQQLLMPSAISMKLADGTVWGKDVKGTKLKKASKEAHIKALNYRTTQFDVQFNEYAFTFKGDYGLIFRAYNEGVAYRFTATKRGEIEIVNEQADFVFDKAYTSYMAYSTNVKEPEAMAFQNLYTVEPISQTTQPENNLAFLPITVAYDKEVKMTISESDLDDYPGMFIKPHKGQCLLTASFAKIPVKTELNQYRCQEIVTERGNVIARTKGTRQFPWRIMAISSKDTEMPLNNLVYALAPECKIGDCSWIEPGKAAWEWWNDWGLSGVDFKAGINMDTYKYYIDFAAKNHLRYVVLDEGWYNPRKGDVMTVIPELNLEELVAYAKQRNVKLILWAVANVLDDKLEEACKHYSEMGIAGFKVDFIDRDDQEAVKMVYRLAEATAKYKMLIDYHGMYKPTGLNRTYPNVINYEAVFGMEEVKWGSNKNDMPAYDVTMPFIRMQSGPVDFTPGAMRNSSKVDFRGIYYSPMSQGTRCHQLAMYIVYDSPLTMLCDAPTNYQKEEVCTQFIASVPDNQIEETKILAGKLGEYIVTARRYDNGQWCIGGMTNWDARTIPFSFSFLEKGEYIATIITDGINANKRAEEFRAKTLKVDSSTTIDIPMAQGGGFVIRVEKSK